jgi:hypothetical protein
MAHSPHDSKTQQEYSDPLPNGQMEIDGAGISGRFLRLVNAVTNVQAQRKAIQPRVWVKRIETLRANMIALLSSWLAKKKN